MRQYLRPDEIIMEKALVPEEREAFKYLDESSKQNIQDRVINQQLRIIKEKFFKTDLRFIADTRGDITKLDNYDNVRKAVNILADAVEDRESKQRLSRINVCLNNLEGNKKIIKSSIDSGNDVMLSLYTVTAASIVMATTIIMKNSMEDEKEVKKFLGIFPKRKSKNDPILFMRNIDQFNDIVKTGRLQQLANSNQESDNFSVTAVVPASIPVIAIIGIGTLFLIKEVIYYFYYARNSLAGYLNSLADLVELNANTLSRDKEASDKQRDIAKKLSAWADKVNTDDKLANREAKKAIDEDKRNAPSPSSLSTGSTSTDAPLFL